jgi:hypothetical protein
MRRALLAAALALASFATTSRAFAQEPATETSAFGPAHPFVLSVEHIGGVSYERLKFEDQDSSLTHVQVGLFTPFLIPVTPTARLGLHYVFDPGVSVGALLSYADNDELGTSYVLGARVGYAVPLSHSTSLWARAGALYIHSKVSLGGKTTTRNILPGGELLFVFQPADNFGIILGPMFEIGVAGKQTSEPASSTLPTRERSFDYYEASLTFGVLADF